MPGRIQSAATQARAVLRRGAPGGRRGRFVTGAPSAQSAVDSVGVDWASELPLAGVRSGSAKLFEDARVKWGVGALGGVEGARCVELGPLEGAHTYLLEQAGAEHVTAIEANTDAFLKCLVTKELLGMQRCSFLCGDVTEYLRTGEEVFDVCWCAGILYHMVEPVELLELISKRARNLYVWTHYFDAAKLASREATDHAFRDKVATRAERGGFRYTLHRQNYGTTTSLGRFWGGNKPFSNWLTLDDLLGGIEHLGWQVVATELEDDNPNGPAVNLVATRGEGS